MLGGGYFPEHHNELSVRQGAASGCWVRAVVRHTFHWCIGKDRLLPVGLVTVC